MRYMSCKSVDACVACFEYALMQTKEDNSALSVAL